MDFTTKKKEKEEAYKIGYELGQVKSAKFTCIQLFNKFYPNNDDSFLNNLTFSQYDLVFKALLEDQSLNQIQSLLHTYTKNS